MKHGLLLLLGVVLAGLAAAALAGGASAMDTTPPTVTFISGPTDPSGDRQPTFQFTADEVSTFECSLDGAPFFSCNSAYRFGIEVEGPHTFAVRATDAAGNTGAPAVYTWTIDLTAPQVSITSSPRPTSAASVTFGFAGDADAVRFTCRVDGGPNVDCTSPYTAVGPFSLGMHSFDVTAFDALGNGRTSGTSFTILAPPVATISSGPADPSSSTGATFVVGADRESALECRLDGGPFAPCGNPVTYTGLAAGSHLFEARAVDLGGGGPGPVAAYGWTVSPPPPAAPAVALSLNPKPVSSTSVVSTDGTGLAGGEYFVDVDPGVGHGVPLSFNGSLLQATIGTDLAQGVYTIGVRTRNAAGVWSAVSTVLLVAYDPASASATGGGWIVPGGTTSDAGDLLPGLDGSSKANFGFVVKYKNGASTVPAGNLQFHYNAGNFHLKSSALDWLVVTNTNWAHFQGTATIDGASGLYPFRLDARDGGSQPDRMVIRIWAPGADPDAAGPIYKASGDVQGGEVKIQP